MSGWTALSDAQQGVLSRLVERDEPVDLTDLVAKTDAERSQLRLRPHQGHARAAARALVKLKLARERGRDRWEATAAGRKVIADG